MVEESGHGFSISFTRLQEQDRFDKKAVDEHAEEIMGLLLVGVIESAVSVQASMTPALFEIQFINLKLGTLA